MRTALTLLAGLAALAVLGSYLGAVHPLGDSLAVFRLQGAGALALLSALALFAGAARSGRLGMLLALVAGVPVLWSYGTGDAAVTGGLRIYQKNVFYRNGDLAGLEQDIRAAAPDAVMLQEMSKPNLALLESLQPDLPHQLHCGTGGTAIATRLPPVAESGLCAAGLAAMQVEGPSGRLWLVSVHLRWPWPHGQAAQVRHLLPVLEGLEGPVVMAGDFNMVRWSATFAAMARAARAQPAGAVHGSYSGFAPWLVLPIDHVLAPGGGRVEVREGLGSDHLGLLAEVGL